MKLKKKTIISSGAIVQLYTGDGKGKTTAAIGQAVRAAGAGKKVAFFQFLKGGKFPVSEEKILIAQDNIDYTRFNQTTKLFDKKLDSTSMAARIRLDLNIVKKAALSGKYGMIILDEITHVIKAGYCDEKSVINMIKKSPSGTGFVLTGREASAGLVKAADLVTEMKAIKHPYNRGVKAARGVEF
jgi:cob(I)alamin adenosyltransferase